MHISEKVKQHLIKRLEECQQKLVKLQRQRKTIKNLYIVTMLLSIVISAVVTVISSVTIVGLPFIIIPILSSVTAILSAVSFRFNFHDKKEELKGGIEKLYKIKSKLEYVIRCNGDLSQIEYDQILKDF
jgi:phosphate/sulfate permease